MPPPPAPPPRSRARAPTTARCASRKRVCRCAGVPSSSVGLSLFEKLYRPKLHLVAALQVRGPDEIAEERVRPVRPRAELGVELARHEPGVVGQLDDLDQAAIRRQTAEDHPRLVHHLAVLVVELETVAVPLVHDLFAVGLV